MKLLPQIILGVASAALLTAPGIGAAELAVGDVAPDFKLQGSDGKTHALADFKGKQAVVVAWFPKAFTGGCTAQCKSMAEGSASLHKFDVAYFTASVDPMDGEKGNKAFAVSVGADYPILSDPTKESAKAYGVVNDQRPVAQRWTFFIGKDGKILFIDKKVNTASHAQDVAAKLKELGVPARK